MDGRAAPMMSHWPLRDDLDHRVRVDEAADVQHRLLCVLLDLVDERALVVLGVRAGGRGVLAPLDRVADVDVPHVDEVVHVLDELDALALLADAPVPEAVGEVERVDAEADRDRAVVADRLADELEHLPAEARPVLERAAVLVGPPVEERQEELMEEGFVVCAVEDEDVEARVACPLAGVDVQLLHLADVLLVHLLAGAHERERAPDRRRAACGHPAFQPARVQAAVPDLHGGEGILLVEHVAHQAEVAHVPVVPEPCAHSVDVVALGPDRAVLRAHRAPAALGLHRPEVRLETGPLRARAVAVRDLEEAVGQHLRADLDRLEEDVVLGVAGHLLATSRRVRVPAPPLRPVCPLRRARPARPRGA